MVYQPHGLFDGKTIFKKNNSHSIYPIAGGIRESTSFPKVDILLYKEINANYTFCKGIF